MTETAKSKSDWKMVKFGDVVQLSKERSHNPIADGFERYVGLEHIEPEDLRIRRWGNVADGTTFTNVFKSGQVLFGKRRAYQRKIAVADFSGICSGDIYVFETRNSSILIPEFLPFICQSDAFFDHAIETSAGSLSPRTNWSSLQLFTFSLPPITEQKRIINVLLDISETLESYRDIAHQAKTLWKSWTHTIFGERSIFKKSPLSELITYSSDGPFGSKLKTEHYSQEGARVIRLQNIASLEFNDTDKAFIPLEYYEELKTYEVKGGDVVIAGLGDEKIPMGRACIVPKSIGAAVNKADCFCLRTHPEKITPQFLVHFLNSSPGLLQSRSLAQGSTRQRLNLNNIRRMLIPTPNITEQEIIANQLDTLLGVRKSIEDRQHNIEAIRSQIFLINKGGISVQ